ncbi:MAG: hypothetical protein WC374_13325 [Phycisphaerae bacterium]
MLNFFKWFKKTGEAESVEPHEQAIAYPAHEEICAMVKSLQEHFNAYTCIFIEIKKHPNQKEATLKYYLYIADLCNEYFNTFEDLRLFAARLV